MYIIYYNNNYSISFTAVLSSEVDHYTIPDGEVLSQFLDVFEHPSLTGLIITQTAANHVSKLIINLLIIIKIHLVQ